MEGRQSCGAPTRVAPTQRRPGPSVSYCQLGDLTHRSDSPCAGLQRFSSLTCLLRVTAAPFPLFPAEREHFLISKNRKTHFANSHLNLFPWL